MPSVNKFRCDIRQLFPSKGPPKTAVRSKVLYPAILRPYSTSTTPLSRPESGRPSGLIVAAALLSITGLSYGLWNWYQAHKRLSISSTTDLEDVAFPHHDLSDRNMRAAAEEIRMLIGSSHVSTDREDLITHSGSDFHTYPFSRATAATSDVIAYPETTEQVSQIAKICHRRRIPITPYAGGTSIEGATASTRGGLCIDFQRMDKVEVNAQDLDCVVQPGVGWQNLNESLQEEGLFFPPDPGPGALIGGMVGTGCSGTNAAAYGTMKDWVLSLTVVLADGTTVKTRQRPRKSSAGYDLTRLFVGSEGTLGMVTEATLKLTVKPSHEIVAVSTFPTVRDAAGAVQKILAAGIQFAAIEILDEVQMSSINQAELTKVRWQESPTLFFKFTSNSQEVALRQCEAVRRMTKAQNVKSFTLATCDEEREELWSARRAALWSMLALKKAETDKVWTTDVAVPLSKLPEIIEWSKNEISKSGILGSIVGHVADGNFHSLLLFGEKDRPVAEKIVHRIVDKAIQLDGTATGEHGVGLVKRDYLESELGKTTVDLMRKLKLALDPLCLLNCDKVVRMDIDKVPAPKESTRK